MTYIPRLIEERIKRVFYDGRTIPFPDKYFDIIDVNAVLHHIPDIKKILDELKRVCSGHILVLEDDYQSEEEKRRMIRQDKILNVEFFGHPENFHTRQEWQEIFTQHGFKVEVVDQITTHIAVFVCRHSVFVLGV